MADETKTKREIERRFLVEGHQLPSDADWPAPFEDSTIEQVYTLCTDHRVERYRRRVYPPRPRGQVEYDRTVKVGLPGGAIGCEETVGMVKAIDYVVALEEVEDGTAIIRKTRRVFEHGGLTWELDTFEQPPGLVIMEVELEDIEQPIELPPWVPITREVTSEAGWSNADLTQRDRMAELYAIAITRDHALRSDITFDDHPAYAGLLTLLRETDDAVWGIMDSLDREDTGWVGIVALGHIFPDAIEIPESERGKFTAIVARWRGWFEGEMGV